jgi:HK97 family phage major capsid protein
MTDLYDRIARISTQIAKSRDPEAQAAMVADLTELTARLPKGGRRKAEFDCDEDDGPRHRDFSYKSLLERAARTDEQREAARFIDDCAILQALLPRRDVRTTRYFQKWMTVPKIKTAMDTATAGDWVPTQTSAELHAAVRLQTKVAALLRQVEMPSPTFKMPVGGNRAKPYWIAESTDPDAELDANKRIPAVNVALGATLTLVASKFGVRCVPSVELDEGSIVAALPYIRDELTYAMAAAREDAVIKAVKSPATHFDSDTTASNDYRRAYSGLRWHATAASAGNNQAVFAAATAGQLQLGDIRKLRAKLGKYAVNPGDCFWLCNIPTYTQLLSLTDSAGHQLVTTVDKLGSQATLLTGALGALDGHSIIISDYSRSDLNHFGYFDGITTDAGALLLVNRQQFVFGTYRTAELRSREIISTDQLELVATLRETMGCFTPSEPCVGYVYDVRN